MSDPPSQPSDSELVWLGRTKQTVSNFPTEVRREVGFALHLAQKGRKPPSAKRHHAEHFAKKDIG